MKMTMYLSSITKASPRQQTFPFAMMCLQLLKVGMPLKNISTTFKY